MKRVIALALVVVCAVLVALGGRHERAPAVPVPGRIDAEFDPRFAVMQISWDAPVASHGRRAGYAYRYRYRREGAPWSAWKTTRFAGIDLHAAREREAVEVEVRAQNAAGAVSAVTRARVVATVPPTFDCKPHPYGAYPSTCVAVARPVGARDRGGIRVVGWPACAGDDR